MFIGTTVSERAAEINQINQQTGDRENSPYQCCRDRAAAEGSQGFGSIWSMGPMAAGIGPVFQEYPG
ncbi:hypothetical protein ACHOLT_17760 [Desulfitobacterium sp. Sab5]|uniref:hypothetical protein n=1 Tax=Desulfitobacterium nosdiversum TaxID=3375356 RepID=UPI003CF290E4